MGAMKSSVHVFLEFPTDKKTLALKVERASKTDKCNQYKHLLDKCHSDTYHHSKMVKKKILQGSDFCNDNIFIKT